MWPSLWPPDGERLAVHRVGGTRPHCRSNSGRVHHARSKHAVQRYQRDCRLQPGGQRRTVQGQLLLDPAASPFPKGRTKFALEHFAGTRKREGLGANADGARTFVARNPLAAVLDYARIVDAGARLGHDDGVDGFAPRLAGNADHSHGADVGTGG